MNEHAPEIITLLAWVIVGGGTLFLALAKWIAAQLMRKLEGIESAIQQTNHTLGKIEGDLRGEVSALERRHESKIVELDRRMVKVESNCLHYHAIGKD